MDSVGRAQGRAEVSHADRGRDAPVGQYGNCKADHPVAWRRPAQGVALMLHVCEHVRDELRITRRCVSRVLGRSKH